MHAEELSARLRAHPFVPLRIILSSGDAYPIYRPRQVTLGTRWVMIGLVRDPQQDFFDSALPVDRAQIARLEPLDKAEKEGHMRSDDLLTWLRAVPFRPFRITLNSGRSYDIRHPEMMKVGRTSAHVFYYAGEPSDPYERVEMVSLLLMERVEPLDVAAAPTPGDGQ